MTPEQRKPLEYYLELHHPYEVHPDPRGGYSISYPDLPGCLSQAEESSEIPQMAEDARRGWIETEYQEGREIPLPSDPD